MQNDSQKFLLPNNQFHSTGNASVATRARVRTRTAHSHSHTNLDVTTHRRHQYVLVKN